MLRWWLEWLFCLSQSETRRLRHFESLCTMLLNFIIFNSFFLKPQLHNSFKWIFDRGSQSNDLRTDVTLKQRRTNDPIVRMSTGSIHVSADALLITLTQHILVLLPLHLRTPPSHPLIVHINSRFMIMCLRLDYKYLHLCCWLLVCCSSSPSWCAINHFRDTEPPNWIVDTRAIDSCTKSKTL